MDCADNSSTGIDSVPRCPHHNCCCAGIKSRCWLVHENERRVCNKLHGNRQSLPLLG
uniref:Uncharacterized protein n=1 Tax=Arundo donax TaxID=35708 RepID=A0A0A8XZR7_ARUDO